MFSDLRTRADRRPRIDHRAFIDVRTDVHEARHEDRAAPEISGDGGAGDPRLAGVDDQGDRIAMAFDEPVDIVQRGQDETGLGAVDDVDEDVAAGGFRFGDRPVHPVGDLGRGAGAAVAVADRDVDHLDMGLAEAGDGIARHRGAVQGGLAGEIAAEGGVDAAAADLVGAEQDVGDAAARATGGAGQSDIFEIGAGRGEDDVDLVRDSIGPADAAAQTLEAAGIDRPAGVGTERALQRLDMGEGGGRNGVGGGRGVGQHVARPRRRMVAVEAGLGAKDDPGVAAGRHQPGRVAGGDHGVGHKGYALGLPERRHYVRPRPPP